ncbi:MAG: aminodeoxychorismate synthase component I [Armatimonadetes bacterium]|nr:aminodeoxychorismate synthase component I [Armatimonadota bacterium]
MASAFENMNSFLAGLILPRWRPLPMVERLPAWVEPVAGLQALNEEPFPSLLESAPGFGSLGHYSVLAARPFLCLMARGSLLTLQSENRIWRGPGDFFEALRFLLDHYQAEQSTLSLPFIGGAIGYLGYDLGRLLETLPLWNVDDLGIPDAVLAFYDTAVIFDHDTHEVFLVSVSDSKDTLQEFKGRFSAIGPMEEAFCQAGPASGNFSPDGFRSAVRQAQKYIAAGDIYQVNLSQRFTALFEGSSRALYTRLRRATPAPFAAFLDFGEVCLVSASPERFLRFDPATRLIETRPIKGTRPRSADPYQDAALAAALRASGKDRAENVMIVDLERNDLGKVSTLGSVTVPELWVVEPHPTVWHLVSTVKSRLADGFDRVDLLKATFPGGSITGAPKIRAMEIIEELEPTCRGPYTGAIGYFDACGGMNLNIVIRTFVLTGGKAYFQVGAGIVADSDPESEYQETLDKARALFAALGLVVPE